MSSTGTRSTDKPVRVVGLLVLGLSMLAPSCKRTNEPDAVPVWDETPSLARTESLGALSPPWSTPTRIVLDNGLVVFALHEPGTPAAHVRLLLPIADLDVDHPGAAALVVAEALRSDMQRRLARRQASVEVERAPGRIEVVVHGVDADLEPVLLAFRDALTVRAPGARLDATRRRLLTELPRPRTEEVAHATLVARLLDLRADAELVDADGLSQLSRLSLPSAWASMLDPRSAVLIVHAGREPATLEQPVRELATAWKGRGRRDAVTTALGRLHRKPARTETRRLLAAPALPMESIERARMTGRSVVVLGRTVPADSIEARGMARLAQRLLQEEIDTRLTVSGPIAVLTVRIPLADRDAAASVTRALDKLTALSAVRQQPQRLFQAAQLWLGGRVVRASITGEDWTALWSEAMDLADDEASIAEALAREAAMLLEPDPDSLLAWNKRWVDPRTGDPGWRWVVVGASSRQLEQLRRLAPVVPGGA